MPILPPCNFAILIDPEAAPVVAGCGGVRKIRFSAIGSGKGKSGSYRCIYKFLANHGLIVLIVAYPKNIQETISAADKKRITAAIEELEKELNR